MDCSVIERKWRKKYGIAKIEPFDESKGGLYYLCKRIADTRTEWGFKLYKRKNKCD